MPVTMKLHQVIAPVQAAKECKITNDTHVIKAQMALCRAAACQSLSWRVQIQLQNQMEEWNQGDDVAHIGSVVAPFAMGLEGFLVDSPHQRPQVTEFHHHYYYCVLALHSQNISLSLLHCFIRI